MNRVADVKLYILNRYPLITKDKFDIIKIGRCVYIYLVDRESKLRREIIFRGSLPTTSESDILKDNLNTNIKNALMKWKYC